jgi:hypothetical protein
MRVVRRGENRIFLVVVGLLFAFVAADDNVTTAAPTPSNASSVAPSVAPTPVHNDTNVTSASPTVAPTPSNVSSVTPSASPSAIPTASSTTVPPTSLPTALPTDPADHHGHHMSFWSILGKTIAWCIIILLVFLAFGAIMSNRYRIYYFMRGVWYTILALDCTRWIVRKATGRDYQSIDASLNTIIFDNENEMTGGLLLREETD